MYKKKINLMEDSDENNVILNNFSVNGKILYYEEYYLSNLNIIYKIIIGKKEEGIIIKSINYVLSFNITDFSKVLNYKFTEVNDIFKIIINSFINNNVIIKDIELNESMILMMKMKYKHIEKDVEFILEYNNKNKDFNYMELYNNYNIAIDKIENLTTEINKLKEEIDSLKIYYKNKNPVDIQSLSLPELTKEPYSDDISDNTFTIFETFQNYFYLIFSNKTKSIICYELKEQKIIIEIKNGHKEYITNFRHYFDKENKRDLILSLSYMDKNIKLWDVINWECILDLTNLYVNGYIYSSCFLNYVNNSYILTSNCNLYGDSGPIKVYEFNGKKIKEIKDSSESTSFIDTYFDKQTSKCFIITGNSNYVKSYDYANNEEYHKYSDNYNNNHLSVIISNSEDSVKLIESCYDGNIRVWNFYTGELINKIKIGDWLYGICLWNDNYLFVGCSDKSIKLVDIINGYIVRYLKGHNNSVLTIKKITHPFYGECIISQGYNEDQIKLWVNKD